MLSYKISGNSGGENDIYRMSASRLTPTRLRPSAPLSASRIEGLKNKNCGYPLCGVSRREGRPAQRSRGES